jgi:hypothetical protein
VATSRTTTSEGITEMPEHGEQEHVAPPIPEAVQRERAEEETAERDDSLAATERRGRNLGHTEPTGSAGSTESAGSTGPAGARAAGATDTSLPATERRERAEAEEADAEAARREDPPIPGEEYRHRG